VKSFKLVPRPLNEGPRPESGKLMLNVHGTYFGRKINWFRPKNSAKRRGPDLGNPKYGYLSSYIISLVLSGCDGGGRPFHPSVPSSVPASIHPSSSSRKKKMTEEEEEKLL